MTAIDFVEEAIRQARAKATSRGLVVDFRVKDAMTLGEWNARFASIVDSGLFHIFHAEDQRGTWRDSPTCSNQAGACSSTASPSTRRTPEAALLMMTSGLPLPMAGPSNR